jgi:hypothetical protein
MKASCRKFEAVEAVTEELEAIHSHEFSRALRQAYAPMLGAICTILAVLHVP